MDVRIGKTWNQLSRSAQQALLDVMDEEVEKQVNHTQAELQKLWLQFGCIVLHRSFDFDKEQCLLFLANWREMYAQNNRLKSKSEQDEYLATELDKIFGKDGYPKEYIDKLEEMK